MAAIRKTGRDGARQPRRGLRADAALNRVRILDAAEQVFAKQGPGASTELVARGAGVGVGTIFRHFPTKEALLLELLRTRMARTWQQRPMPSRPNGKMRCFSSLNASSLRRQKRTPSSPLWPVQILMPRP